MIVNFHNEKSQTETSRLYTEQRQKCLILMEGVFILRWYCALVSCIRMLVQPFEKNQTSK